MAPPPYNDLGSQARDIFNKHYYLGSVKLDVKTKTTSGIAFNVSGSSNNETGKVLANMEAIHTHEKYGLTFKEKWNTDNTLVAEAKFQDKFINGFSIGTKGTLVPHTGSKKATITTQCKGDLIHLSADLDLDPIGTMVYGSAVIGLKEFLFGTQVSFDPKQSRLTKTNFAVNYNTNDFSLYANLNEKSDFNGSVYHKVNESLESAISFGWSANNSQTRLALGCVYKLDGTTSIRTKINNNSQLCLGFALKIRPGILLTLSSMVDMKNINAVGHKIGMGIELNAT